MSARLGLSTARRADVAEEGPPRDDVAALWRGVNDGSDGLPERRGVGLILPSLEQVGRQRRVGLIQSQAMLRRNDLEHALQRVERRYGRSHRRAALPPAWPSVCDLESDSPGPNGAGLDDLPAHGRALLGGSYGNGPREVALQQIADAWRTWDGAAGEPTPGRGGRSDDAAAPAVPDGRPAGRAVELWIRFQTPVRRRSRRSRLRIDLRDEQTRDAAVVAELKNLLTPAGVVGHVADCGSQTLAYRPRPGREALFAVKCPLGGFVTAARAAAGEDVLLAGPRTSGQFRELFARRDCVAGSAARFWSAVGDVNADDGDRPLTSLPSGWRAVRFTLAAPDELPAAAALGPWREFVTLEPKARLTLVGGLELTGRRREPLYLAAGPPPRLRLELDRSAGLRGEPAICRALVDGRPLSLDVPAPSPDGGGGSLTFDLPAWALGVEPHSARLTQAGGATVERTHVEWRTVENVLFQTRAKVERPPPLWPVRSCGEAAGAFWPITANLRWVDATDGDAAAACREPSPNGPPYLAGAIAGGRWAAAADRMVPLPRAGLFPAPPERSAAPAPIQPPRAEPLPAGAILVDPTVEAPARPVPSSASAPSPEDRRAAIRWLIGLPPPPGTGEPPTASPVLRSVQVRGSSLPAGN